MAPPATTTGRLGDSNPPNVDALLRRLLDRGTTLAAATPSTQWLMTGRRFSVNRDHHTGRADRTLAAAERDAGALALREAGMSYRAIARELGWADPKGAWQAVRRSLDRIPAENVAALRAVETARLDRLTEEAMRVVSTFHPVVSNGRVFPDLEDDGPKLQAINTLIRLSESRRRLLGLDLPARHEVTVSDDSGRLDTEIAALLAELDTRARGDG